MAKKVKEIKTATFNDRLYHLFFGDLDGNADTDDKYWLIVERDLNKKVGLETAIHEALHAGAWSKSEKVVERTARDMARFLWRLGYRREK